MTLTVMAMAGLLVAGVVAGILTTVASLGGGILLIALLSTMLPVATVLGLTAPALFVGNFSRAAMLRRDIDWPTAARFSVTAIPSALAASLVAAALPGKLLQVILAVFLLAFCVLEARPRAASGTPEPGGEPPASRHAPWLAAAAGGLAGTVSGLTGGAGFVSSPLLLKLGLPPMRLVATSATCMAGVHLAKGAGFSLASVLTPALAPGAVLLAAGIVAGNALGARVLARLSTEAFRKALVAALALASLQLLWSGLSP